MTFNLPKITFPCLALCLFLLPSLAFSKPVTFEFTGHVTDVYEPASSLPAFSRVDVGSVVTGNYVFESTTEGIPDPYYHLNHKMQYEHALVDFNIMFGKSTFSLIAPNIGIIYVQNNDSTGILYKKDRYEVNTGANLEFDGDRISADIILIDGAANAGDGTNPDGLPGTSSSLPLYPPELALFDITTRIDIYVSTNVALRIQLDTLTRPPNRLPRAEAGSDQIVLDEVQLDGSASTDSDGSIVSFDWHLKCLDPAGTSLDADGMNPLVTGLAHSFYEVTLTVTDDEGGTAKDNMLLAAYGLAFTPDELDQAVSEAEAAKDVIIAQKDETISSQTAEIESLTDTNAYLLYGDFDTDGDVDAYDLLRFSRFYGLSAIDIFDDADGDTFTEYEGDCDDTNNSIHPGTDEICGDGMDNNCDGTIDEQPCIQE